MSFVSEYVSPVAYAIGWVVTGLGWFVTHHHATQREIRKEVRASIDKLLTTLNDLVKCSCDYYTESESPARERHSLDIHVLVEQARRQIESLEKNERFPKITGKFTDLYEAITGGNFESKVITTSPEDIEKCKRISVLNGKITECLENWYSTSYLEK